MYENVTTCVHCGYSTVNEASSSKNHSGGMTSTNNSFGRSLRLIAESFKILIKDKEVLVFSLVSLALSCVAMYMALHNIDFSKESKNHPSPEFVMAVFVAYFLVAFITTFGRAGVIAIAYERMMGNSPTLSTGFSHMIKNLHRIFLWALFVATVGLLFQMFKSKKNWLLRTFLGTLETAWNLIAFIALPVVVIESTSIGEGVKKTEEIFKRTWGENLVGGVSMGVLLQLGIFISTFSVALFGSLFDFSPIVTMLFSIIPFILIVLIFMSLNAIYAAGLYYYATTGKIPDQYSENIIRDAFAKKN
jgi:hypothetical protein